MRILATIFNIVLIGVVIFEFIKSGIPKGNDWLIFILLFFAPIFNMIALFVQKGDNWLSLFLKRKALEEKQKIDQLTRNKD
jgi:hypothetical protein